MIISYIVLTTLMSLFFTYVWGTSTFQNVLVKLGFSALSIFGIYLLINLLPAVQLPNGMRLL